MLEVLLRLAHRQALVPAAVHVRLFRATLAQALVSLLDAVTIAHEVTRSLVQLAVLFTDSALSL